MHTHILPSNFSTLYVLLLAETAAREPKVGPCLEIPYCPEIPSFDLIIFLVQPRTDSKRQVMGAKLSVAVLCLLVTWRTYTALAVELTFSRSGENANRITLSCLIDTFPAPSPTFYTIIPGSSQRLRVDSSTVQDYQPVDGQDIIFTLTPETEAKFSCESQGNESSSVLLAGGSIYYSYKYTGKPLKLKRGYIVPVTHSPRQLVAVCYE